VTGVPFIPPLAKFTASPFNGTVPLKVSFTDQSTGSPTLQNYDFGDGIHATGQNPVYTYQFPGVYNVTLIILKNNPGTGSIASNVSFQPGIIVVNR
jgi:PKD repeat protein